VPRGVIAVAGTHADTLRVQPWAQVAILLLSSVTLIAGTVVVGFPVLPPVVISLAALVGGTIVVFWVERRETSVDTGWLAVVPLIDIVAIAVIAAPLSHELQLASALVILPLSWLAVAFDPVSIVIGVLVSASVPASHALATDSWPQEAVDWVPFVLAPIVMAVFATSAYVVGRQLRENQRATDATMERLREESRARAADVATMTAIEEGTEDAVAVFDRAGALLRINATARRLAWQARLDFRRPGLGDHRVFAADRLSPVTFPDEAVKTIIDRMFTIEHVAWLGAPGDQVAVHYRMFPIATEGELVGAAIIAHDVTELVEGIEVRDRFLDSVGHELRTPLTVLLGETDLALMSDVPESVASRLAAIDAAASRLLTTVEHLTAAGRESVAMLRDTAEVAIITGDTVATHRPLAAECGVTLHVNNRAVGHSHVDTRAFRAILTQVLVHAIRFTPAGGEVVVSTDVLGDSRPVVEIRDTGVGMTETERRRAFERFYRSDYARDNAIPGAGVGLSIAKKLADQAGIGVELLPAVGGGLSRVSCFRAPRLTRSLPPPRSRMTRDDSTEIRVQGVS